MLNRKGYTPILPYGGNFAVNEGSPVTLTAAYVGKLWHVMQGTGSSSPPKRVILPNDTGEFKHGDRIQLFYDQDTFADFEVYESGYGPGSHAVLYTFATADISKILTFQFIGSGTGSRWALMNA